MKFVPLLPEKGINGSMATGVQTVDAMSGFRDAGIVHPIREPIGHIPITTTIQRAGEYMRGTGITKIMAITMKIVTTTIMTTTAAPTKTLS